MSRKRDVNNTDEDINEEYHQSQIHMPVRGDESSHSRSDRERSQHESQHTNTRLEVYDDASRLGQHEDDSRGHQQTYQSTTLDRIYHEAWPIHHGTSSGDQTHATNTTSMRSQDYQHQYQYPDQPSEMQQRYTGYRQDQPHRQHEYQYQYYRPYSQSYEEQSHESQSHFREQYPPPPAYQYSQQYYPYPHGYYQQQHGHSFEHIPQPSIHGTATMQRSSHVPGASMGRMQRLDRSPYIKDYQKNDVLCGRGGATNSHAGNIYYRNLVKDYKDRYLKAKKKEKPEVAAEVVRLIRQLDPPGRFLKKDKDTNCWVDIGDVRAKEKTSQALREGAPILRQKLNLADGDESVDLLKTATSSEDALTTSPKPKGNDDKVLTHIPDATETSAGSKRGKEDSGNVPHKNDSPKEDLLAERSPKQQLSSPGDNERKEAPTKETGEKDLLTDVPRKFSPPLSPLDHSPPIPSSPLLPPHRQLKSKEASIPETNEQHKKDDDYDSDDFVPFPQFSEIDNDPYSPGRKKRAVGRRPSESSQPLIATDFTSPIMKRKMATVDVGDLNQHQRELYSIFDPPSNEDSPASSNKKVEVGEEESSQGKKD